MKVIVGMGNPGPEYTRTRHNVGWWVVDHLADVWRFDGWKNDGNARVAGGTVGGQRVRLLKPLTYMNLSGAALRPYLRREGFAAAHDLMIVIDEVALPVGSYRVRARGSAGGHNGLKSIESAVGSQDYARLRVGVGPEDPRRRGDLADYVLGDFGKREEKVVRELFPDLTELLETWLSEGAEIAMNRFNKKGKGD
ncbi:MAG TPA: aminoacyl-tRNA hydrolase [Gemmatimonadaceae bacterium]|nr:aminoacyl-tRNA hydrolase [Gemmatimonadaceae bacterium]